MTRKEKQARQIESENRLREIINPKDKIYCILRSVSKSGMSRRIDFYKFVAEGDKIDKIFLTSSIADYLGYSYTVDDWRQGKGLRVGGCGMDMGFSVVYNLGYRLFKGGDGVTVTGRNGDTNPETDGGYLLNYEWI